MFTNSLRHRPGVRDYNLEADELRGKFSDIHQPGRVLPLLCKKAKDEWAKALTLLETPVAWTAQLERAMDSLWSWLNECYREIESTAESWTLCRFDMRITFNELTALTASILAGLQTWRSPNDGNELSETDRCLMAEISINLAQYAEVIADRVEEALCGARHCHNRIYNWPQIHASTERRCASLLAHTLADCLVSASEDQRLLDQYDSRL